MWTDKIEGVNRSVLTRYFTADAPLGPINARLVTHDEVLKLLTERDLVNLRDQSQRPSIVVGRRGSGKTSYLRKLGLAKDPHLFLEIKTEKTFNLIIGAIQNIIRDAISVESIAIVWDGILWNCLFWLMYRSGQLKRLRPNMHHHLQSIGIVDCPNVEAVMSTLGQCFQQIAREAGGFAVDRIGDVLRGREYEMLKAAAVNSLEQDGHDALIVLDSLDENPVKVEDFKKPLAGLLKCAGEFNAVMRNFDIRLCLPSELYWEFVEHVSTNSTKDFSNQVVIRWRVGELLVATCRRMMIHLMVARPEIYAAVRHNPLETRADAEDFIAQLFPSHVSNLNGVHEKTIDYILRHTQLLPRQLFLILGEVLKINAADCSYTPGKVPFVKEASVRLGIVETEDRIVREILSAFKNRYPDVSDACNAILPTIPKVCTADQFSQAAKSFADDHQVKQRMVAIRKMLIEIGALGKIDHSDMSYTYAKFEYMLPSRLPVGAQDKLCVHPLFSRVFDCKSRGLEELPIYPISTDL